jgi:hypothetical protein
VLPTEAFGVYFGSSMAIGYPGDPFSYTLSRAPDGPRDLLAGRVALIPEPGGDEDDFTIVPLKLLARRALNPADGSAFPLLDFSSAEAFDPVSATVTLAGINGEFELNSIIATANGTQGLISLDANSPVAARTFYGLPADRMIAGDLVGVEVSDNSGRTMVAYRASVGNFTAAFGPVMPRPSVGVDVTAAPVRMLGQITVGDATTAYGGMLDASFVQTGSQRAVVLHFAQSIISNSVSFATPDLSGVSGWNEGLFGLQRGSPVDWLLKAANTADFVPADGAVLRYLDFEGQITP